MAEINNLNGLYKLESLSVLPDYCLQEIFSREFSNIDTARILFLLSAPSRDIILRNLNAVRAANILQLAGQYKKNSPEPCPASFERTCEMLLDRVQELKDNGIIKIPEVVLDNSFFDLADELHSVTDALPNFNMHHMDLHDIISWWDLAAKGIKSLFGKRVQMENIILDRLEDSYSSKIFSCSIDDLNDAMLAEKTSELQKEAYEDCKKRLDMSESFLMALIRKRGLRTLAADLAENFPDDIEMLDRLSRHSRLLLYPALKVSLPPEDVAMSLCKLKHIHDELGTDEMLKFAGTPEDHYLRRGLQTALSGMEIRYAEQIVRERKKAQLHETEAKLRIIGDAVACIRNRVSGYIMLELMSSYTVYDFAE
ncbi:hypothetical protein [Maridesulfovibrio sp.]|uniref:hypothetical protein n=1 Tax=Maridesulfovibrio sp. TaxID=2795000 RepID=UPI002A18878C|nr:hypothetical protein [Maridesulfovibrio sp.]